MGTEQAGAAIDEEFQRLLALAGEASKRGDLEPAREALEDALAIRSRDPQVLGQLGQVFYRLGRYDDAAIAWQRLVDDNPVEPGARVNLGLAWMKARQYEEAIKQLRIALAARDPAPHVLHATRVLSVAPLGFVGKMLRARSHRVTVDGLVGDVQPRPSGQSIQLCAGPLPEARCARRLVVHQVRRHLQCARVLDDRLECHGSLTSKRTLWIVFSIFQVTRGRGHRAMRRSPVRATT